MIKNVLWTSFFALAAVILQSTLLMRLTIYRAGPDIALVILIFSAYYNGSMTGQLVGFSSGILLDFLSAAPLGLNALIRTVIGAVSGLVKGFLILDAVFLPMLLCMVGTLFKALLLLLLHILFSEEVYAYPLTEPTLMVELAFNTFLAPFLFALLNQFKSLLVKGEK
ncbi:MAG: rod shape-determining protein MreD [Treponema sp.]|jgi:rod shape-determining protein MreD|nr:rod shape-determining protein MreD [Treponema sp.]